MRSNGEGATSLSPLPVVPQGYPCAECKPYVTCGAEKIVICAQQVDADGRNRCASACVDCAPLPSVTPVARETGWLSENVTARGHGKSVMTENAGHEKAYA